MSQKSPSKTQISSQKDKDPLKVKETKAKEPKVKDTKDKEAAKDSAKKEKVEKENYSLPLARIKTIMKSCPNASFIAPDALFMVCKSTVSSYFMYLTPASFKQFTFKFSGNVFAIFC
jgi:hypothetical protein